MTDGKPDSIETIRQDLGLYFRDNLPVEIWLTESYCFEAFIIKITEDHVLSARIYQRSWLNGFRAIKLTAIHEVLPANDQDEAFMVRAVSACGVQLPPETKLDGPADSIEQLARAIAEVYPVVILVSTFEDGKGSSCAGTIQKIEDGIAEVRTISLSGDWLPEIERVDLKYIDEIFFGSEYEKVLFKVANQLQSGSGTASRKVL